MAIENNDDRDEKHESAQDECVEIPKYVLGALMGATEEEIDYEDHGDTVVVSSDDLKRLQMLAVIADIHASREG